MKNITDYSIFPYNIYYILSVFTIYNSLIVSEASLQRKALLIFVFKSSYKKKDR